MDDDRRPNAEAAELAPAASDKYGEAGVLADVRKPRPLRRPIHRQGFIGQSRQRHRPRLLAPQDRLAQIRSQVGQRQQAGSVVMGRLRQRARGRL